MHVRALQPQKWPIYARMARCYVGDMVNRRRRFGQRSWLFCLVWSLSCQAQAGMFCQQQSDCRAGLVCTKPAGQMASSDSSGICEPARRGSGESCLRSADCQSGLVCSNELEIFNGDERHGLCQSPKDVQSPDGGIRDQGNVEDLPHPG